MPNTIWGLTYLSTLDLQDNQLTTLDYIDPNYGPRIEAQVSKLTNLSIIRLNNNRFDAIPSEIFELPLISKYLTRLFMQCHAISRNTHQCMHSITSHYQMRTL